MAVPLIDLRAQYRRIKEEIDAAVAEVLESQQFIGGPKVEAIERAVADYAGARHAVGVASGTDALLLTIKSLDLKPGDEVITPAFTFSATAGAVVNGDARPVFIDIDPTTFNMDVRQLEAAVTGRTRAVLPVHLFGQCADMDAILSVAARAGLFVLEDAAQSLGARYGLRAACSLGTAGAVSFFPTKNLGGVGEGGMVLTPDESLARQVRLRRNHGADATYYHRLVGTNSRLDALQAAVLLVKLRHLDTWIGERRANARYYDEQFAMVPEVKTPIEVPGCYHVYNQYVIRLPRRDAAIELFRERGIGCAVYYPVPLHRQECFLSLGYDEGDFPEATRASLEVLALPIYSELTREQQDEVVAAVKGHLARC